MPCIIGSMLENSGEGSEDIACDFYQGKFVFIANCSRVKEIRWLWFKRLLFAHLDVFAGEHAGNQRWNVSSPSMLVAVECKKEGL